MLVASEGLGLGLELDGSRFGSGRLGLEGLGLCLEGRGSGSGRYTSARSNVIIVGSEGPGLRI